jgi:hypothetical protein
VRPTGAFVACVFLALAGVASAQKVVSPPEIAPPPIPSQPPSPGAGVSEGGKKQTAPENSPQNTDQDKRGTEDSPLRWQSNEVSLFFIGYVIYDDYFDMQHTTRFCARYSRDAGPGWAKAGERAYNYNRSQKIEETPL